MVGIPDDDVVEDFDFEKLAGSNEITSNLDVSFRRSWLSTYAVYGISGVIPHPVLCRRASRSMRFCLG